MPAPTRHLIESLPPMTAIIQGSLVRYYHQDCRCHPKGRYGPYWRLSVKLEGRTKMYQVQPRQLPKIRKAISDHRRWWKTCLRIFVANTERLLAQEG